MSLYIIEIGGTGHRVTEAVLQLAACGAVPTDKIKLMTVDSDGSNGNLDSLIGQIKAYKDVSQKGSVLRPELEIADVGHTDRNNPCWSPTATGVSMEMELNKLSMDPDGQTVFDFLYTKGEQETVLDRGFYGHTSIGSLLIAEQIRPDGVKLCKVWDDYFNGININEDKVILIGSTFGGTGASGIPVISTILRQMYPGMMIGAVLVMPYFQFMKNTENPNGQLDIAIDWTYFMPKTKAALSYYEKQKFDQIFNELYIIGENSQNFTDVKYSTGANSQANKPHIIELFCASAIIDFLKSPCDRYNVKVMARDSSVDENGVELYESSLPMLTDANGDRKLPYQYAAFMRACVMYTKYYYHCIKEHKSNGQWYNLYRDIPDNELDNFYELCKRFINWIRKAHMKTDQDGGISDILEPSVKFFDFSMDYLFDFEPEKGGLLKNNIVLRPLNGIADIIVEKPGCPDAEEINSEFEKCEYDNSLTAMGNLIENLKYACSIE